MHFFVCVCARNSLNILTPLSYSYVNKAMMLAVVGRVEYVCEQTHTHTHMRVFRSQIFRTLLAQHSSPARAISSSLRCTLCAFKTRKKTDMHWRKMDAIIRMKFSSSADDARASSRMHGRLLNGVFRRSERLSVPGYNHYKERVVCAIYSRSTGSASSARFQCAQLLLAISRSCYPKMDVIVRSCGELCNDAWHV